MQQKDKTGQVTVVIPCYNCASSLERAVSSVAMQALRPAELVLVDDASTDATRQVISQMCQRYGFDWVRVINLESNVGPATARNAGWNVASQPYLAFLDADDAWHTAKLEAQLAYMQAHPDIALTAHAYRLVRPGDARAADTTLRGAKHLTRRSLLVSNCIATPTVILKRDLPYRFRDGKRYAEDYLLWLQIACDGHRIELLNAEWAYAFKASFGESGLSACLWKMEKGELAVFWQLVKEGCLVRPVAFLFSVYSLLKYFRRHVIVAIKQFRVWSHPHGQ